MKKSPKLLFVVLFLLIIVVACNNDTSNNEIIENDTEENQGEEAANDIDHEVENDNSTADSENDEDSNSSVNNTGGNGDILGLGETGVMETALGNYEVTPLSFKYESEMNENDPVQSPLTDTFIVIDFQITNTGDEIIETDSILASAIVEVPGRGGGSAYEGFETINNLPEEVAVGETVKGQMLFDSATSEEYQLSFGAAYPDSLSNTVTWILYDDEVSN